MTTTHTPGAVPGCVSGSVQRTDDPNIHGVAETKAFFKTTKFIVFIVATAGVLLASYLVKANRRAH
jgi:hypothetical protein